MYDLEEIRRKVSLIALAEEAGARFQNEHRLSCCCPLPRHAGDRNNPTAFHIYDGGKRWKCFTSCPPEANGGDIFTFYMAWKGVEFNSALVELAERAQATSLGCVPRPKSTSPQIRSIPPGPSRAWQARAGQFIDWAQRNLSGDMGVAARAYLEKARGLWSETWLHFGLGYCPKNLYDSPQIWGLDGKRIWLPRGLVIPGMWKGSPWYIKIRRPMVNDALAQYIGAWTEQDRLPEVKFGGPRGGQLVLFGLEQDYSSPVLLLAEGEWDAMLTWQWCQDLCDVGTLGGAQTHLNVQDLITLVRYLAVIVVHDDDQAGDRGREYISKIRSVIQRIKVVDPPAHDLTDFWKGGGNLRAWVAGHVADAMEEALQRVDSSRHNLTTERWQRVAVWARQEKSFYYQPINTCLP